MPSNIDINRAFVRLGKRAEAADPATLVQTFVDIGTLLPSISVRDHQIIFGRRGTGKTHALIYVLETASKRGASTVYVDLRTIGSSGGLYGDTQIALSERATRLLLDVLGFVHETLYRQIVADDNSDLHRLGPLLDALGKRPATPEARTQVSQLRRQRAELPPSILIKQLPPSHHQRECVRHPGGLSSGVIAN